MQASGPRRVASAGLIALMTSPAGLLPVSASAQKLTSSQMAAANVRPRMRRKLDVDTSRLTPFVRSSAWRAARQALQLSPVRPSRSIVSSRSATAALVVDLVEDLVGRLLARLRQLAQRHHGLGSAVVFQCGDAASPLHLLRRRHATPTD